MTGGDGNEGHVEDAFEAQPLVRLTRRSLLGVSAASLVAAALKRAAPAADVREPPTATSPTTPSASQMPTTSTSASADALPPTPTPAAGPSSTTSAAPPETTPPDPPATALPPPEEPIPTADELLANRSNVRVLDGTVTEPFRPSNAQLAAATTLDARTFGIVSDNSLAVQLGSTPRESTPPDVALIGGLFRTTGNPERVHDWWYHEFGSEHLVDCLLPANVVIDGLRIDNCTDGLGTRSQFGEQQQSVYEVRNTWVRGAHDDAIENDQFQSVRIRDSLIEDAYIAISMRRPGDVDAWNGTSEFVLDRSLIGLGRQPVYNILDPSSPVRRPSGLDENGHGHGPIWKLMDGADQVCPLRIVVKDCIFYLPMRPHTGRHEWPNHPSGTPNRLGGTTRYENCVVVYPPGRYPAALPPGVTQTRDVRVWTNAVAQWRSRHGYRDFDTVTDPGKIVAPDPWVGWPAD